MECSPVCFYNYLSLLSDYLEGLDYEVHFFPDKLPCSLPSSRDTGLQMWLLHGLSINRQWWLLRWAPPLGTFGESPLWLARDTLESAFPWPHRLSLMSTITCMNFSHARWYFIPSCENLFVARPPYLKVITIGANRNDFLTQYFCASVMSVEATVLGTKVTETMTQMLPALVERTF